MSSGIEGAQPPRSSFYYHGNDRIDLEFADFVAIRWHPGGAPAALSRFPVLLDVGRRDLPLRNLQIYPFRAPLSETETWNLIEALAEASEVEHVAPVFQAPETLMVATDQLIARFAPNLDEGEIARLCEDSALDRRGQIASAMATYLLGTRSTDVVEAANRLHERPEVVWAQPDFLRLIDRPNLSPSDSGPRSAHLETQESSFDPPTSKGTHHLLVTESVILGSPNGFEETYPRSMESPVDRARLELEDFEGPFPDEWQLIGEPTWAAVDYRPYSGLWSGYGVGSSIAPPGPYPNHVDAWMVFGPFSLVGAQAARVDLQAWIDTESYYDYFEIAVSIDGDQWYGLRFSGNWGGWRNIAMDFEQVPNLGGILGQSQVWLALVFESDVSIGYEGVYVDDIVIETITGGYQELTSDEFDHLQWSLENNQQQWGITDADIGALDAWEITPGSDAVIIAVIDEGVDLTHPDLAAKLVPGYDATGGGSDGDATGDEAHGTACAAIAAAVTDNGLGVAGVAREARIMPVRIFVGGYTLDSWAADGISWAVTHGADVLSNSWGGGLPSNAITDAIDLAVNEGRDGKGALVVFASGNSNSNAISYPANLAHSLAIGALSPCDQRKSHTSCDGDFWWGSNYGPGLDVLAPGVLMHSADLAGESGYQPGDYLPNFNGTSSATPVVAGVAALLLSLSSDLTRENVELLIRDSAQDLLSAGWDLETGHGRVDAHAALLALLTLATDLEAVEVFFRDEPAGNGLLVENPIVDQQVYPYIRFKVTSQFPLTGRIATLDLDDEFLCEMNGTLETGEYLFWCDTPWQASPGIHELRGQVDPGGLIDEANEANNQVVIEFTVSDENSVIFSDGFESGDHSMWSSTTS